MKLKACIHVTSAEALPSILKEGLIPQIGLLSAQLETHPGIFMFPSWDSMMDANWLYENWPHESEPALLCVNTEGLELDIEAGFEAVFRAPISADRLTVLAPGESDWDLVAPRFYELGGRAIALTSEEIFKDLEQAGRLPPETAPA